MRLAGVDDRPAHARGTERISAATVGTIFVSRATSLPSAVAEAAVLDEVALHVDDDERGVLRVEHEVIGAGADGKRHGQCPAMCWPIVLRSVSSIGDT